MPFICATTEKNTQNRCIIKDTVWMKDYVSSEKCCNEKNENEEIF